MRKGFAMKADRPGRDRRFEWLRPTELAEEMKQRPLAYLPVGPLEYHGPHLPLGTDTLEAQEVALRAADKTGGVALPPFFFGTDAVRSPQVLRDLGFSGEDHILGVNFPSNIVDSLYFPEEFVALLVRVLLGALVERGYRLIVIVNGHGGNETAISNALHDIQGNIDAKVYNADWWRLVSDIIKEVATPPMYHGCEIETSVAWYLGERVLEDRRIDEPGKALVPGFVEPDMLAPPPHVSTSFSFKEVTDSGIVGYSTKATKEKGKIIVDAVLGRLVDFIKEISKL